MFHWICPECGREIAPTVRECPACDPGAMPAEPALVGVVEAPTARVLEADGAPAGTAIPVSAPGPVLPQLAATLHDDPLLLLASAPAPPPEPAEPPQAQQTLPLAVPAAALARPAPGAELRPPLDPPQILVTGSSPAKFRAEPPPSLSSFALPQNRPRKIVIIPPRRAAGSPVAVTAPAGQPEAPKTPYSGPAPALAPLTNYSPLAGRPLRPAVPNRKALRIDTAPRTTLPGPMLTPRLVKFRDRELKLILPEARLLKKRLIPGWLVSALIIGTLLGAGFNSIFSSGPRSASESKASPRAAESAAPAQAPGTGTSLSKGIEVTGFRIQIDPRKKSEIQYLVVNHTAARFSGVTVYVTLHSTKAAAGEAPLAQFSFAGPNLGPYESKEMSSAIEGVTRPVALPDWQDLRAEVEIAK